MLPISLVAIVRNAAGTITRLIEKHKDLVSEIIIVDQKSDDNTVQLAESLGATVYSRSNKGSSEHDREYAFSLASNLYILYLDDDEYLSDEAKVVVKECLENNVDVCSFKRKNLVDGVDIYEILGDDWQPRLFRVGSLAWTHMLHMHPKLVQNSLNINSRAEIIHDRSFKALVETQNRRKPNTHPDIAAMQDRFIIEVKEVLRKAGQNV